MSRYQKSTLNEWSGMLGESGRTAPLESLKLWQSLDVDAFLELLNRTEAIRPKASLRNGGLAKLGYPPPPTTGEILRGWVNEWLDSGRASDGDDPRRRNFTDARETASAAFEYSKWGKIGLMGFKSGLEPFIQEYPKEDTGPMRPLVGPRAKDYAREQLVFFLLSQVRFSLARCRNEECGIYFLLNQWNRLYPNGTLCEACKRKRSHESAKVATAREREAVREALHRAAAKRFRREIRGNPLWYRTETHKQRVADFLNAKFADDESFRKAYPIGLTGKWVANVKNWKPIEATAKGGK